MREAVLILEDNDDKTSLILSKYRDTLRHKPVFIARSVEDAKSFLSADQGLVVCFLDHDLGFGCGTGMELLEWLALVMPHFVFRIYITAAGLSTSEQMRKFCEKHNFPHERLYG